MATGPIEGITVGQQVADIVEKAVGYYNVLKGIVPWGPLAITRANVRGHSLRVFKTLPPALGDFYRECTAEHGGRDALVFGDERLSFGEVQRQIDAFGAELMSTFGVQRGERVAIAMRNMPEFAVSFLGITACGAIAVPFSTLWTAPELEFALQDSGAKVAIMDPERLQLAQPFLARCGCRAILCRGDASKVGDLGGAVAWADVLRAGSSKLAPPTDGITAEDDAMILYTSGSTGTPKGVVHTQRSLGTLMKAAQVGHRMLHQEDPRFLLTVPLFHVTALSMVFLSAFSIGATLFMMRRWDASEALDIIEKHKINRFTGVPTMVRDMLEHPAFSPARVASLKMLNAGGAPTPPSQVAAVVKNAKTAKPIQGYGLTEAQLVTINRGVDYMKHPTSCGKPVPFLVECRVVDPKTGKQVKAGERGELIVKSAMLMRGYHNRPEETAKAIDEDGFFHTGDVAKMEGGYVYILDRLKDVIIRGGENIECSEIEVALYSHPAVRECSVFGLPDPRLGEVVGAAVWLHGDNLPTTAELSAHVASKLAKHKVPAAENIFLHSEALPKIGTGKLDKKGLRDRYSAAARGPPASKL